MRFTITWQGEDFKFLVEEYHQGFSWSLYDGDDIYTESKGYFATEHDAQKDADKWLSNYINQREAHNEELYPNERAGVWEYNTSRL